MAKRELFIVVEMQLNQCMMNELLPLPLTPRPTTKTDLERVFTLHLMTFFTSFYNSLLLSMVLPASKSE
jgi:hypothetical protein